MKRKIYLDKAPERPAGRFIVIADQGAVNQLYETVYLQQEGPAVCLDCRSLTQAGYGALLKFVEEYRGDIELVALDPVPTPIYSRFVEVSKEYRPSQQEFLEAKLRHLPEGLKQRIYLLFGISSKDCGYSGEISEE